MWVLKEVGGDKYGGGGTEWGGYGTCGIIWRELGKNRDEEYA